MKYLEGIYIIDFQIRRYLCGIAGGIDLHGMVFEIGLHKKMVPKTPPFDTICAYAKTIDFSFV
ncbi:MAG: hypothetical protein DWQ02_22940 [Bacteroidetes bacterium]|nr:MAG: hypothetical protein DWQ02_22940 [Bacteroidota bacterium]